MGHFPPAPHVSAVWCVVCLAQWFQNKVRLPSSFLVRPLCPCMFLFGYMFTMPELQSWVHWLTPVDWRYPALSSGFVCVVPLRAALFCSSEIRSHSKNKQDLGPYLIFFNLQFLLF